jgi:tetratricopeptide (TPR) repeat protein
MSPQRFDALVFVQFVPAQIFSLTVRSHLHPRQVRGQSGMPCPPATVVIIGPVVCCILFAFFPPADAQSPARDKQADDSSLQNLYDTALSFQKAGNFEQATGKYRAFLSNAQGELAAEYAAAGDFARAAALFKAALTLQPDSPALRLGYAKTALLMGNPSLAKALAQAFLDDNLGGFEQIAQAHRILGRALLKMNRDREARSEMQKAVDLDSSFANRYDLAVVCLDQDDGECVASNFQALKQSFGDTPAIHMQFGLAYGNSDFAPQAIDEFRKVIAEDPRYPEAHYSLAAALLAVGGDQANIREAEDELKKELEISPHDFLTYAALGKLAVGDHRYAEADTYLKHAISLNPNNPDAYLYLGQMCFETNRPADAEAALRKAITLTRDPSRNRYQIQKTYFLLGRVLMQEHRPDEARAEMELSRTYSNKALSNDKRKLTGLLNNSQVTGSSDHSSNPAVSLSSARQQVDSAAMNDISAFDKRLTPVIADSYNNLGVILALRKNYAAAADSFANAAHWNPGLAGLDLNWGRAAFSASKFAEAIQPLTRYVHSHPQDSNVRAPLGISQYMTGDYRGCVATLKTVEQQLGSVPQIAYVYADSLARTGRQTEGIARLVKLEKQHPEIADVHRALSDAYKSTNQYQKADAEMQQYSSLIAPSSANSATSPSAGAAPAKNE